MEKSLSRKIVIFLIAQIFLITSLSAADFQFSLKVGEQTDYLSDFRGVQIKLLTIREMVCVKEPCKNSVELSATREELAGSKPLNFELYENKETEFYGVYLKLLSVEEGVAQFILSDESIKVLNVIPSGSVVNNPLDSSSSDKAVLKGRLFFIFPVHLTFPEGIEPFDKPWWWIFVNEIKD